jgi:hypothetical protein
MLVLVPFEPRKRVFVDPADQAEEEAFERMMARLQAMTPDERLRHDVECGLRRPDGSFELPVGDPCVTLLHPVTTKPRKRVFVDPADQAEQEAFERMMARLRAMTPDERLRHDVECGIRNSDGSFRLPVGDPCVTRVSAAPTLPRHRVSSPQGPR